MSPSVGPESPAGEEDRKVDELLQMSQKELSRLEVMKRVEEKRMRQQEAATVLGISKRQVKRLLHAYCRDGSSGLISKRRGQAGNHRLAESVRAKALKHLQGKYRGFGPTLAHEKLVELDGLQISDESVRQLMIAEELWKPKKARKVAIHQMRERRACFGELVQIDGSPHDWFEGRAPACTLLVFIDDATGKLGHLQLVESESFFSYAQAAAVYFNRYGKPVAFYSDRHSVFRVNQPSVGSEHDVSQFGRAMHELDIEIICANTPQAKGRVERAIQTLQDRLPKELRLRGISSWKAGNAYLPEFIQDFNQRFSVSPRSDHDAHRPLTTRDPLDQILTWQETRLLSKNLTVQFQKVVYQIRTSRPTYAMRHAAVTVCLNAQGQVTILYQGKVLPYTIFHRQERQAEVVDSKQVNAPRPHYIPGPDHPWKKSFFANHEPRTNV
jgi:transposase